MEFRLSDGQFELQGAVRKYCAGTMPVGSLPE
jgi:hypothetical protein